MPRWEPNTRERLAKAALELFFEKGYDQTTVKEIADKAGVAKSTFFRHYADKQDVLSVNNQLIGNALTQGIESASTYTSSMQQVTAGLINAAKIFTPEIKNNGTKLKKLLEKNPVLQQGYQMKVNYLINSMVEALKNNGVPEFEAKLVANMGSQAFQEAYSNWIKEYKSPTFPNLVKLEMEKVRQYISKLQIS